MLHVEFEDKAVCSPASSVSDPQHSCSLLGLWRWISKLLSLLQKSKRCDRSILTIEFSSRGTTSLSLRQYQNFTQISSLSRVACFDTSSALFICILRCRNVVGRSKSSVWLNQWLLKWQQAVSIYWETTKTEPFKALVWTPTRSKQLLGCCWKIPLFPASVMGLPRASICAFSGFWSVSESLRLTQHLVEWLYGHSLHAGL